MRQDTSGQPGPPRGEGKPCQAEAVMSVLEESVALFLRLRAALEDIHGHSEISGAMRGVMRDLKRSGPLTVPQLARRRPVSRQHIQAIVNDLQRAGFVTLAENPRHKRSRIVQLTSAGQSALEDIISREHAVLNAVDVPVSIQELRDSREVMGALREMMENPGWRETVRTVLYQDGDTPENPWIDERDEFRQTQSGGMHRN